MNSKLIILSFALCFSHFASAKQITASDLSHCQSIKSDSKRLTCYDNLATRLNAAKNIISTPKEVKPIVTEQFGLKEKRINEPEQITATITKIKKSQFGLLTVYLDNEQIWKQSDSARFFIKVNDKIEVKKAAFGSFMMKKVGSNKTIRVKRLQ